MVKVGPELVLILKNDLHKMRGLQKNHLLSSVYYNCQAEIEIATVMPVYDVWRKVKTTVEK